MRHLRNRIIYSAANQLRSMGFKFNSLANPNVREMRAAINDLENKAIDFKVEMHPDGSWSAESANIDGIITGGTDPREIPEVIRDAVFTYFEVPPQHCEATLLRGDNEAVTIEQRVHVGA